MVDAARLSVRLLSAGERPELVRALQALRYRVFHDELGQEAPTFDHAKGLDVDPLDADSAFAVLLDKARGEVVGGLRLRRRRPYWAEQVFALTGPAWRSARFAEATRFVAHRDVRSSAAALLLRDGISAWAHGHGLDRILSLVKVYEPAGTPEFARALYDWLAPRVVPAVDRAAPIAPGVALDLADTAIVAPPLRDPTRLPAMLRSLANQRTLLCAPPTWSPTWRTWDVLLVSGLTGTRPAPPPRAP